MIVVDTNIITYFWLPGEYTAPAVRLLKKDSEWVVPLLWRSEFRNVLAFYFRKGMLPIASASQIIYEAEKMFAGREYTVSSEAVIEKLPVCSLSAYDLEYVVLAEQLEIKLVTLDKKVLKSFPEITLSLKEV